MLGVGAMPHAHHAMSPSFSRGKHVVLKVRLPLASGGVHEMTMSGPGPRPISPARERDGSTAIIRESEEILISRVRETG